MLGQKELVCFCVNGGRLFNDGDPQIGRRAEIEQKYISCFVLWREILDQLEWERPGSSDEEICSFVRKVAEFFDIWTPMHGEKGKFLRLSCSHVHWHVLFFIAPSWSFCIRLFRNKRKQTTFIWWDPDTSPSSFGNWKPFEHIVNKRGKTLGSLWSSIAPTTLTRDVCLSL